MRQVRLHSDWIVNEIENLKYSVITGFLVDQFGTYEVTFVFAGIMMCVGGTSAPLAKCIHSQSEESKDDIDQSED